MYSHRQDCISSKIHSYYYDTETGFYYLQSRYYDPTIGRFINADTYVSTGQGFLGYNTFAYCLNNPSNFCDPTGELAFPGEIHNEVVRRIKDKYGFYSEQYIAFSEEQRKQFGKLWGRADLVSPEGRVWDVKRDRKKQITNGQNQVAEYVQGKCYNGNGVPLSVGGPEIEYDFLL